MVVRDAPRATAQSVAPEYRWCPPRDIRQSNEPAASDNPVHRPNQASSATSRSKAQIAENRQAEYPWRDCAWVCTAMVQRLRSSGSLRNSALPSDFILALIAKSASYSN